MTHEHNTELATMVAGLGSAALVDDGAVPPASRAHLEHGQPHPAASAVRPGRHDRLPALPGRPPRHQRVWGFGGWFYRAVGDAPEGKMLVLSSGGYPDASHGGGTKLSWLHNQGLAGVLPDGRLRDFDELAHYRFATWCAGEATRRGGDTVTARAANTTVEVGGVTILPGDHIYADRAGAVGIPARSMPGCAGRSPPHRRRRPRFPQPDPGRGPCRPASRQAAQRRTMKPPTTTRDGGDDRTTARLRDGHRTVFAGLSVRTPACAWPAEAG